MGATMSLRRRLTGRYDQLRSALLDLCDRLGRGGLRAAVAVHPGPPMGIAIVGCGFVADFYATDLARHPDLRLIGVFDTDAARAARFARDNRTQVFQSLEALLDDPTVELVVNLTNPDSHYAVSRASLAAGRHVYSEKPLAMRMDEARALVALAAETGVRLSGAPCAPLGESLEAVRRLVRAGEIGQVRVVYAELDDGPIHRMGPDDWVSPAGTPWPWRDEFQVGCTLEHAGYHLAWLVALFGSAISVTGFSATLAPEKHPDLPPQACAPDFSVGCIVFESGVVARLTCSILAPHDHAVRIVGDLGVLSLDAIWHFGAPTRVWRFTDLSLRADSYGWIRRCGVARDLFGLGGKRSPASPRSDWRRRLRHHEMDYALGVADLAHAVREGRAPRLSAELALHVNELALAISQAGASGSTVALATRVEPWPD
jgi:predicted dehydrogenase